jgi:hypothetical protein
MTGVITFPGIASRPSKAQRESARTRFPPRPAAADWPATRQERGEAEARLTSGIFVLPNAGSQERRVRAVAWFLDWLSGQPGETWQQRWMASGADAAGGSWREEPIAWQRARGRESRWLREELSGALVVAICGDLVRPSLSCLVAGAAGKGSLTRNLARTRDPGGFARLQALCDADPHVSAEAVSLTLRRSAEIIAAKGGVLADITVGDVLELMDREAECFTCPTRDHKVFYRMLRELGIFGDEAPERLRAFRTAGQLTPEELVDRYQLQCRPVRDLLVDYLRERQPAVDYTSLKMLAYYLAKRFWADLEEHHPGIGSLHLPGEVADAWKQRQRTKPQVITSPDGEKTVVTAERIGYRQCLTPVRGVLPGPVPVGTRGPRPVGTVGRSLPGQAGRDQPAEIPAPPQGAHGRADPGTAARPAGAGPHRRRAAQELRRTPAGRPPGPAWRGIHRRGPDANPVGHQGRPQDLGRRPGSRQAP